MKKRFFITLVVVLCVESAFGFGYFYLWQIEISPLLIKFQDARRTIQITDQKNQFFKKKVQPDLTGNEQEYKNIQEIFYVPGPDNSFNFILFIEQAVARNHLQQQITSLPAGSPQVASIQVTGAFLGIMKFLREFENEKFLLRVENFAIQGSGSSASASLGIVLQTL